MVENVTLWMSYLIRLSVVNEKKDMIVKVFNMLVGINESNSVVKHM